ncbi:MAG: hypothetical protein KIT54_02345 [Phycisphaeraceae bacterium]|nr:hypothetical protein [Phycisphaeraceae bacterium]
MTTTASQYAAQSATNFATSKPASLPELLAELRATRARAQSALEELQRARAESEARMTEKPGGDPYKRVAGVSSLERAAVDAQRVIASVDRQLAALSPIAEIKGPTAPTTPTAPGSPATWSKAR